MASVVSLCSLFILANVYIFKRKNIIWATKIGTTYNALKLRFVVGNIYMKLDKLALQRSFLTLV